MLVSLHDEANWLVHKIIALTISYKHSGKKWVNISQQTIRTFIAARHARTVQQTLLDAKVVLCNGTYVKGVHSMGWRLGFEYRNDIQRVAVIKPSMVAKILAHRIRFGDKIIPESQLTKVHAHLLTSLRRVRVDTTAAYSVVDSLPQRARKVPPKARTIGPKGRAKLIRRHQQEQRARQAMCRLTVDQIRDGAFDYTVDNQGRVHTPVTRLLTDARRCLSVGGCPLVSIDIKNSQLLFFTMLLMERRHQSLADAEDTPSSLPPSSPPPSCYTFTTDEADFIRRVQDGTIYDHLGAVHNEMEGLPPQQELSSRREFKSKFFEVVLYGNTHLDRVADDPLAVLFQHLYPSVWGFIQGEKQWDGVGDPERAYARLAVRMQQREARFMIGQVCTRLMQHHAEVPVVTVHDSVMTAPNHVGLVERIMIEEFRRLGVKASLRID